MFYFVNRVSSCFQQACFANHYKVGKTKHVANKKLHGWKNKACCKQEVTRLAKQNML
jgi:hypothetical protein